MQFEHIAFSIEDGVARLRLNRPDSLNALSRSLLREFSEAVELVAQTPEARVLELSGEGRGFSGGADLAGGSTSAGSIGFDVGAVLEQFYNPLMKRLFALEVPIVAAVQGPVAGAGCMLALAADIVIAARSAYFLQAFVNIGLVPDAGSSWWLPRLIGPGRALAMMMLGEKISAETAASWGMIYEVVENDELSSKVAEMSSRLAAGPTRAYALIRQAVRTGLSTTFEEALAIERINQKLAGDTRDFREGIAAFREKRRPDYTGE